MSRRHAPRAALACTLSRLVAGALYLADRYERRRILGQIAVRLASRVSSNAAMLDRQIGQLRQDVLLLSSVPPVRGMVRASGNGGYDAEEHTSLALWRQRLESIFIAYAGANGNIVQVRLIGMADGGRELLRVDRQGKEIAVVSEQQLQAKGEAEYMRMTARLAARQVYVSDMNLNREHGLVQQPAVAVLRVATPLYDAGAVMAPLHSDLPELVAAYLNNSDGDFLLHPDPSRAFGFDRGRRWRWQDQLPGAVGEGGGLRAYAGRSGTITAFSRNIVIGPLRPRRSLTTYTLAVGEAVAERELDGIRLAVGAALLAGALAVAAARLYRRQLRTVHEYQARMSAIVESSNDAIIGKTLGGIVTSWNDGAEKMFGYRADEAIGCSLCALIVPPDALDEEADMVLRVGRGDTVSGLAAVRLRRDGGALAVSITASPIRGADARVIGIAKTVRDVSEQVAADERIRALNASLERQVRERTAQIEAYSTLQRAILADAPYSVIATDTDGLITLFNPAAEAMLGYAAAEVVGLHSPALFQLAEEVAARAPALSAEVDELIRPGFEVFVAKARRGLPNEAEWTYVRRDGTRVAVLLSVSAAEVAELGIWSWNLADNALEWSERMYAFFDVAPAQRGAALSLEHWRARLHPDDVDAAMADLHAAVAGAARYDAVFRVVHADGDVRHIQAAASIERNANGAAVRVLGVNRDVTAQREAEQVLRAAMQAAGLPLPSLNGAAALVRFGGNARAYGQALRGFSAELPQLLAAVPCASPLAPHSGAGAALHDLKGLAATIGAEALAEQAQAMERTLAAAAWPSDWDARRASLQVAGEQAAHAALALAQCMLLTPASRAARLAGGGRSGLLATVRRTPVASICLPAGAVRAIGECHRTINFPAAALQCAVMQRHLETNLPC